MNKRINREKRQSKTSKEELIAPAVFAGITAVGAAGYYTGILPELLDSQHVINPSVIDGAVDGMVTVNEAIRQTSPIVALTMAGAIAAHALKARFSTKDRMLNKLSHIEYSGIDDIVDSNEKTSKISFLRKSIGGVAVLSATLIMSTSGLEKEITNGPNRPTEALVSTLSHNDSSPLVLLEESEVDRPSEISLMDSSIIPRKKMNAFIKKAGESQISVMPFSRDFMNVNGGSAMELSVPDEIFERAVSTEVDQDCSTVPVIVDQGLGAQVGDSVDINGTLAEVVRTESNIAQQNRNIVLLSDTDMKECLRENTDKAYFGAVISGSSIEAMNELMKDENFDGMSVITKKQFFENNKDFWSANGTPIILILMGSIAVLGGIAGAKQRSSALRRNAREIGMLNANGVSMDDIAAIERRRTLRESLYSTGVAVPLGIGMTAAFNASVPGLSASIDVRAVTVAAAITGASSLIASQRAVKGFSKHLDIPQAVKG